MMNEDIRDRRIFEAVLRAFAAERPDGAGDWMVRLGRYFLQSPYAAGTLERPGPEALVVNLRQFDCMTLVETVTALTRMFLSGDASFEQYRNMLAVIRYRQGRIEGYASRLHYFSDWLFDNTRKGIVRNVSRLSGGTPLSKRIHYMTQHPVQYPALRDRDMFRQMRAVERRLQQRLCHYIPRDLLKDAGERIAEGDIIAVTTRTRGLDVTHVGLAVRQRQGIHFLHASNLAGEVVITKETLTRYLARNADRSGIILARITAPPEFR